MREAPQTSIPKQAVVNFPISSQQWGPIRFFKYGKICHLKLHQRDRFEQSSRETIKLLMQLQVWLQYKLLSSQDISSCRLCDVKIVSEVNWVNFLLEFIYYITIKI